MAPKISLLTFCLFFTALAYAQPVDLMVTAEPTDNSRFRNTIIIFACSGGGGFLANIALFIAVHMNCKKAPPTEDNIHTDESKSISNTSIGESESINISSQSYSLSEAQEIAEKAATFTRNTVKNAEILLKSVLKHFQNGCKYVSRRKVGEAEDELDHISTDITELKSLIDSCSQLGKDAKTATGTRGETDTTIRDYLSNYEVSLARLNNIKDDVNTYKQDLKNKIYN